MARVGLTMVELTEVAGGYEFSLHGARLRVMYDDGLWVLDGGEDEALFESFNEAMNFALDGLH